MAATTASGPAQSIHKKYNFSEHGSFNTTIAAASGNIQTMMSNQGLAPTSNNADIATLDYIENRLNRPGDQFHQTIKQIKASFQANQGIFRHRTCFDG